MATATKFRRRTPARPLDSRRGVGIYAATRVQHTFRPDAESGTSCVGCYGWRDDPRHPFRSSA